MMTKISFKMRVDGFWAFAEEWNVNLYYSALQAPIYHEVWSYFFVLSAWQSTFLFVLPVYVKRFGCLLHINDSLYKYNTPKY